jgi:hypothetical protein
MATKVRTSFPLPFVNAPAFEPRENATPAPRRRAAAPPPLVMPAIEPG